MRKRLFAVFVSLCMIVSLLPTMAFAEVGVQDSGTTIGTSGLCEHHAQHDESCGYTEGIAEIPCSHAHTEECYQLITNCVHKHTADCYSDGILPVDGEEKTADGCSHVCSEDSGCITKTVDCKHEHDESCGYVPAVAGSPCTFVCEVCNAQDSEDTSSDAQPECTCKTLCTEDSIHSDCPVCAVEAADLATICKGAACICATLCAEGVVNPDCPVCAVEAADLTACKGEAPMLLGVPRSGILYLDENGQQQTAASATSVTDQNTAWDGSTGEAWYVVDSDVTINSRITVTGTVHLILTDGYTLTASQGIQVAAGNSLTIYAQSTGENMGVLTAETTLYDSNAAIGGSDGQDGGTITINGGTVNATSYTRGAGIGGGNGGDGGMVTINGGTVTAMGSADITFPSGNYGAGIGGGNGGDGGTVIINGGTVTASSKYSGAGIGGGKNSTNGDSFSTGANGTALIIASGSPAISDQSDKDNWSGIIIENGAGQVYGNQTIDKDLTLPAGNTLTIPQGISFTILSGVTFTNAGSLINEGSFTNEGTLTNAGTLTNEGSFTNEDTLINEITLVNRGTFTNEGNLTNQNTLINQADFQNMGKLTNDAILILVQPITGDGVIDGKDQTIGQGKSVSYLDEDGQVQTCSDYTCISTDTTKWNSGWYVAAGTVTINSRITVTGNVNLILTDGCTLTVNGGIQVADGNSLIIYAQSTEEKKMGILTAQANNVDAAIGGSDGQDGGDITINGGTVTASATSDGTGAGIGGGDGGSGGDITINGGTVTASGDFGAGIGGGNGGFGIGGSGGDITINGGTVNATASIGAGIGGGDSGSGGDITINGGTVNATASTGAGIGGGFASAGGDITITGGEVTASGYNGAGIGGGEGGSGGTITITSGEVIATNTGFGAGIGGGQSGTGGDITIHGGTVTARGNVGAGIGGAGGDITITGGTVTATGGDGAGIGGNAGSGGTVTIHGGTVDASGYRGAGIGDGESGTGSTITITGGTVTAKSSEGDSIGKGFDSTAPSTLTIGPVVGGQIIAKAGADESAAQPLTGSPFQSETSVINQVTGTKYFYSEMQKFTAITAQPQPVTVTKGDTATFEVTADGTGTLIYQWQQSTDNGTNWININGANAASYITPATTMSMNGYQYRCVVTGDLGNATSDEAILTVTENSVPPTDTISAQPMLLDFGTVTEGYAEVPAAQTVTLTNTGDQSVTVALPTSTNYTITEGTGFTNGKAILAPNGTAQCIVQPKTGLAAGTYSETILVSGTNQTEASLTANFTVVPRGSSGGSGGGGGHTTTSNPQYAITVLETENGSIRVSPERAKVGDRIKVTAVPQTGYALDSLTVTDADGKTLTLNYMETNVYTFEMPKGKVEISAVFAPATAQPTLPFIDVQPNHWFYDAICYVVENGLMHGMSENTFSPNMPLQRELLAVILWNLAGNPEPKSTAAFSDVIANQYYAKAIAWASENGIVSGYGDTFGVGDSITREQFAVMLYRYVQYKGYDTTQGGMAVREFSDYEKISDYAKTALAWAVNAGIMHGMGDGTLAPQGQATRAEAATMLMQFCEQVVK